MPFVLVKNEFLEGELDGIVACSCRAQAARKLNLELARFTKRSFYCAHLTLGCGDLKCDEKCHTVVTWQHAGFADAVQLTSEHRMLSEQISACQLDWYPRNCTGAPSTVRTTLQKQTFVTSC